MARSRSRSRRRRPAAGDVQPPVLVKSGNGAATEDIARELAELLFPYLNGYREQAERIATSAVHLVVRRLWETAVAAKIARFTQRAKVGRG